jgi:predicted ATPase
MLTRLKVSGFKNLVDMDVRFGPFTCIAGTNGVGKSNLFDAIRFLSVLADMKLLDAARSIRGSDGWDVKSLFSRYGNTEFDKMTFMAEMVIPGTGTDDLGQHVEASTTFVRYDLELGFSSDDNHLSRGGLVVLREELTHIKRSEAEENIRFRPDKSWFESAISGEHRRKLISTSQENGYPVILLHQNRMREGNDRSGGKPAQYIASNLPTTVLSQVNTTEHRTALLTRREFQSWRFLQLEPSAMREPDQIITPPGLDERGNHLPATLYQLARKKARAENNSAEEQRVYSEVAHRLSQLIDDVKTVRIDRDEIRQQLTLYVNGRGGVSYPARSLSDGTLRFLALAIMEHDPDLAGVLCLEEPENGIHPKRIPVMLRLLQGIATDVRQPVGRDNPLRQVIVNTHSPLVVQQVPEDALVVADVIDFQLQGRSYPVARFHGLSGTWREEPGKSTTYLGQLISYLDSSAYSQPEQAMGGSRSHEPVSNGHANGVDGGGKRSKRVVDREDVREFQLSLFNAGTE